MMAVNVNEDKVFRINNGLCYFSNNGAYLAVAFQTNLYIKDAITLNNYQSFVFADDVIQHIEWSTNNEYILCTNTKKSIIQIYSIHSPQWKWKLTEGSAGLRSATWSPDSKYILTIADFNIQISIWNLENRTVSYIQNLKSSAFHKLHFDSSGKRLAVIVTEDGKDIVEIYKTDDWKISRKLICDRLHSIDGIRWSPNDELLCIWCSYSVKLIVYSTVSEKHVIAYSPQDISPSGIFASDKTIMGIENVEWEPNGQLLAVVGFNQLLYLQIVLLNYITWKPLMQLHLNPLIRNNLTKVYKEHVIPRRSSKANDVYVLREVYKRPAFVIIGKRHGEDSSVADFNMFEFSMCGQFLAVQHKFYPKTVWIWDIFTNCLDCLLLESSITAVKWCPRQPQLLVFSECMTRVYEWFPVNVRSLPMPKNTSAVDVRWHPAGKKIALCSYNKATIYDFIS